MMDDATMDLLIRENMTDFEKQLANECQRLHTALSAAQEENARLREAITEYKRECDNPVHDYSYRRHLRNQLFKVGAAEPEAGKAQKEIKEGK